jgi:hypothetical protein
VIAAEEATITRSSTGRYYYANVANDVVAVIGETPIPEQLLSNSELPEIIMSLAINCVQPLPPVVLPPL